MKHENSGRRSFMTGLGAAVAAGAAGSGVAQAQTSPARFAAARHTQDDWLVHVPGKHRILIDAVTPKGAGEAVLYANNLYVTNKSAYQLEDEDLAIVIVMRNFATPFAFNDAAWAKYGKAMSAMREFKDPKTKEPPSTNLYNVEGQRLKMTNLRRTTKQVK